MGKLSLPDPAGLFCAILAADQDAIQLGRERLIQSFGELAAESETIPFVFTTYYEAEMGPGLVKQLVGFRELIQMGGLPQIKLETNRIEAETGAGTSEELKRKINLDPGYVTLAKVVLATTKNRDHRIYLGSGIFAEVTLRYRHGRYAAQEWTYPDYESEQAGRFFLQMRAHVAHALASEASSV